MMSAVGMVRAGLGITILPASAHEIRAEPNCVPARSMTRALNVRYHSYANAANYSAICRPLPGRNY